MADDVCDTLAKMGFYNQHLEKVEPIRKKPGRHLFRIVKPIRAVVFDYHLLGLGLRYSDYRNVTGSLGPVAADAFRSAYGETDPREKVLDDLMAPLCALIEAFRRPGFPSWAEESLKLAESGEIHNRAERVMGML